MNDQIDAVLAHLDRHDPGDVVGVYLYRSATTSGLRPDSDLDLLVVTRRSLGDVERRALAAMLLDVSVAIGDDVATGGGRHIELTSVVVDDLRPLGDPPRRDFQFGEWHRDAFALGEIPAPVDDPDVVILVATARSGHRVLRGAPLDEVLDPVDPEGLRRAMLAIIPDVLAEIVGDERNTLLTLSRILVTLETGRIVAKDAAADRIAPTLDSGEREVLERAAAGYRGELRDAWTDDSVRVNSLAMRLAERARRYPGAD